MAELTIRPEEIRSALSEFAASYKPAEVAAHEVGHVVFAADGIAHVEGLPGVMANELLTFEDGTAGLAMNLEERRIGVVILGSFDGIDEGQVVRRTGEVHRAPWPEAQGLRQAAAGADPALVAQAGAALAALRKVKSEAKTSQKTPILSVSLAVVPEYADAVEAVRTDLVEAAKITGPLTVEPAAAQTRDGSGA